MNFNHSQQANFFILYIAQLLSSNFLFISYWINILGYFSVFGYYINEYFIREEEIGDF